MSSKSRNKSSRKKDRKPRKKASPSAAPATGDAAEPTSKPEAARTASKPAGPARKPDTEPEGILGEDVIHVPKGRNRLQFAFMIGLLVLLLVIFMIPGALMSTFGTGRGDDPDVLAFDHPSGDRVVMTYGEFLTERNALAEGIMALIFTSSLPAQYRGLEAAGLGLTSTEPSRREAARLIVLDALAQEAGILITDADLSDRLSGQDPASWLAFGRRYGSVVKLEENLRRVLRIRRYVDTLSYLAQVPDVAKIEERWTEEHVELAFDYVELDVTTLQEEAEAEVPADEELQAWFDERPEFERNSFMTKPRFRPTLATFRDAETTAAAGLLEKYPEAEDAVAEDRAFEYYNLVRYQRFRRPEPEETEDTEENAGEEAPSEEQPSEEPEEQASDADPAEDEQDADAPAEDEPAAADEPASAEEVESVAEEPQDTPPALPWFEFDEVKDDCLVEAPVYHAMGRWLADLRQREIDGEEIDLAAEATELGLEAIVVEEALDLDELRENEEFGGVGLSSSVARTEAGKFGFGVVADAGAISIVRVNEKIDPEMPPFEEIREGVAEKWAEERTRELAVEKLEAIRDGFAELVVEDDEETDDAQETAEDPADDPEGDEEEPVRRQAGEAAFRAAVEAAGYEVQRRPWLDKAGSTQDDPDRDKPGHLFFTQQREYFDLETEEVPEATLNRQRTLAYLVRKVGEREMDIARMSPMVYQGYKQQSAQLAGGALLQYLTGSELEDRYGIEWEEGYADDDFDEYEYEDELPEEEDAQ